MPGFTNYRGDNEFFKGASYASLMGTGFSSFSPRLDAKYSPLKRSRLNAPFVFSAKEFVQKKMQTSIEVLPDECLFEILRRLPGRKEKSSCALVSKKWLMLLSSIRSKESIKVVSAEKASEEVEDEGYLTRCLKGKKATDNRLAAIAVGIAGAGGLGRLSIQGNNTIRGVSNVGLAAIGRRCPSLKVLSAWDVSTIGDQGLTDIANGCHKLEKLELIRCPLVSDRALFAFAENCHGLTSLTIESCPRIGNDGLQAIARGCPKLHTINIKDCPLVGDQGISTLVSSSPYTLVKIKLQNLNITEISAAIIGHYGINVTELALTGLQCVSERGFWVMAMAHGLQKLESLAISSCPGLTDRALEKIGKGSPNLKNLSLHKCSLISDNGLVAYTKCSLSIKSIQLHECNEISQNGVLAVISNCGLKLRAVSLVKCMGIKDIVLEAHRLTPSKYLKSLSVRDCPGFGSNVLAVVGWLCPQLEEIDICGLSGVTDAGFLSVVENCQAGLMKVNLSGCTNITDSSITSLARLHSGMLQYLNLGGCSKVTDESLAAIALHCYGLEELDVSKCAITDLAIASLCCERMPELLNLYLSGCSQITDKCIPFLVKLGEGLISLNLRGCTSVSGRMVDWLAKKLCECEVVA
ncbi:EIN3-binding F-box protein 1-like [Papaver somniferum]|uniref:EIN3-binding F-box protein 1-like n=1 Tax=Papaver somniferum TaxID=3469 RepID=UPI000E6F7AAB|nr:EIN3-binding F-box protein 1-like [Papaver somniferum]XP_026441120.1 EIN3-binding F-box protein 1-like [Papaver somniferum]